MRILFERFMSRWNIFWMSNEPLNRFLNHKIPSRCEHNFHWIVWSQSGTESLWSHRKLNKINNTKMNMRHLKSDDEIKKNTKGGANSHAHPASITLYRATLFSVFFFIPRVDIQNDKFLQNYLNQILCLLSFVVFFFSSLFVAFGGSTAKRY